jgi:AcrR family transcriptional regulator
VSDVDDTPRRLVAAAERLFTEGGEEATSLRAITREAISNAAAVHYHFGGRDGLLRAVLDRYLAGRQERRLRLLDRAVQVPNVPVSAVLTAVLRPDLELLAKLRKNRVNVARFLGRAYALRSPVVSDYLDRQFATVADRAVPVLAASLSEVGQGELRQRLRLVLDAVAMLYARAGEPGDPGPLGADDVDEQLRRVVAFATGALSAPAAKARRKR